MPSKLQHRVSAADDDLHQVRLDVPLWSESALITCHDPATGISVYGHLVLLQNEVWESIFSVYLPNGEMCRSNGDLIAKARQMAEDVGRRAATVAEARELLGLRKREEAKA